MKILPGRDMLAGLAVAGLILPEGIAYAGIAGLPPGRALAAGITGGLAYLLVGRSRFAIISPTSSSAAILAAALVGLNTDPAHRAMMATALTLIVGVIFLGLAAFRVGGLAGFVSRPVLRGFAFGLAITIVIKQLPKLTGVATGGGSILSILTTLGEQTGQWHWPSILLGMAALCSLIVLRRVPRMPAALLIIVAGILFGQVVDLHALGIAEGGPVALSLSAPSLPDTFALWAHLAQLAAPIALILFAESWGTMRGLALAHGDTVNPNRELAGLGLANGLSALAQGMPVGAGFSAGTANEAAGATSRVAALTASLALLALALFAAPMIAHIPEPVLAAVVIAALTHALSPRPLVRLFRIRRDQWVAVTATLGVLVLGVLNGMLAAIALSIVELLYRLSHPSFSELGQLDHGHDFVDRARHPEATALPNILIFRPNAPLIFANAESVLHAIAERARIGGAGTLILSLEESDDLDSTAVEALGEFMTALGSMQCRLLLARAHDRVRDILMTSGQDQFADIFTYSVADATARAGKES
ncbi:STAS domain-containing protein [Sphingobium sufflavum]|uniref:SulP family inorganic anion transporter n=1 Tax=Sphingobium sufflavum TaxID=1129547 RepID=UPI001EEC3903|nr:SulP family inorganic anion transporter [Sphingobium sufflavum]MCE7796740.1 STAS domain-containing protein [Sphingobium sufflavum]